jgi:hypothetical protein
MPVDIDKLGFRVTESYLVQNRQWRVDSDTFTEWHDRIDEAEEVLKGNFLTITAGEEAVVDKPLIMNTAEKFVRDAARLTAEVEPISKGFPKNDKKEEETAATIRGAIADTYWEENDGSGFVPEWTMDLLVSGACFAVMWADKEDVGDYGAPYPRFERVDPRMCYPYVVNGKLYDLMVIKRFKASVLDRMFPGKGILAAYNSGKKDGWDSDVELIEYYSEDECVKAIAYIKGGKAAANRTFVLERKMPDVGCPLAVMAKLPTWDNFFRGQLDGIKGSLYAKNKAVKLVMDNTEDAVYASLKAKGVINPDAPPGPDRIYQLDDQVDGADIGRVPPAQISPYLMPMVGFLDTEQRGQLAYPASRQGQVSQSIASAAFVESTQGDLSSVVKECHRLLGRMRTRLTATLAKLDVRWLDEEKPLCRSVGNKSTYVPSKAWNGIYKVKFVYGPSSGVGVLNGDSRLIQYQGIGVMSDDTLRSHLPDIFYDNEREAEKLQRQTNEKAIQQRFLTDPSVTLDEIADTLEVQEEEGIPLQQAYRKVRMRRLQAEAEAQQAAAAEAGAQPAQPGALPGPEAPIDAEAERLALDKGKIPDQGGAEQLEVDESLPAKPLAQIFI